MRYNMKSEAVGIEDYEYNGVHKISTLDLKEVKNLAFREASTRDLFYNVIFLEKKLLEWIFFTFGKRRK